jgi:septal ring factor EnvC (AmiA/AmiB activator)
MGKISFGQKVEPQLQQNLNTLIEDYMKEGRIKEKGEIFHLLYNDHLSAESKRESFEKVHNAEELNGHLKRIDDLFLQAARDYLSQIAVYKKEYEDQIDFLKQINEKLEGAIKIQREQLKDKTIELYEMEKNIKKLEKKLIQTEKKLIP